MFSRSVVNVGRGTQFGIGAVALAILVVLVLLLRSRLPGLISWRPSLDCNALATGLLIGVVVRLLWVLIFHPLPASDGATYLGLANKLLEGENMQTPNALAYWPPGYSLFLTPFIALLPAAVAVPLSQIALFAVAAPGVHQLARRLGSDRAAKVAVFLFALWPNLVTSCATPEKEMLVTACLVWAVSSLLTARRGFIVTAGFLFGCAALVQPSTQLLIPVALVFLLVRHGKRSFGFLALLILGAALAITPWTARNYVVLGGFKLISTNGGENLYRANNSLATGGFVEQGEISFSTLPELERDRAAKAAAVSWIKAHPMRFVELLLEKQLLFMGDDAYGVYASFRAEGPGRNALTYAIWKVIANGWWLAAWLLIAIQISRGERLGPAAFLVWGWLYLFGLHSVFESTGKYHAPMLWILCICLGVLITPTSTDITSSDPDSLAARKA
jgi:4-amino-4-deoxy-L-arabinose transferase-like glycosyltransferase